MIHKAVVHKVTVRHPVNDAPRNDPNDTPFKQMWVAVCEREAGGCGWFTSYFEPEDYSRARLHGDNHERLHALPDEARHRVEQHMFTSIRTLDDESGKTINARGKCDACDWVGPEHLGSGCSEKANADCSAHFADEIKKELTDQPSTQ